MRGHIRRRHDQWQAIVRYQDAGSGKWRQTGRSFPRRTDAQAWLNAALGRLDDGTFTDPQRVTVAAYLERWLRGPDLKLRPSSVSWYRSMTANHIAPRIGAARLDALTPDRIEAMYADMAEAGHSPTVICGVHKTLRRALNDATRSGLIVRNAVAVVTPPRATQRDVSERVWTPDQLAGFLESVKGIAWRRCGERWR